MTDKKKPDIEINLDFKALKEELSASIGEEQKKLREKRDARIRAQEEEKKRLAEEAAIEEEAMRRAIERVRQLNEQPSEPEVIREEIEETPVVPDRMSTYVSGLQQSANVRKESANLLGGDDAPVTRAELQSLKTALATVGGGGLGEKEIISLILEHAPSGGGGSGDGLDSAQVLSLISDSYVSQLIGILSDQTAVTFGSPDSAGDVNNIYNILNIDSSATLITTENFDSLGYGDSDVIDLLNDSGVQNILPQLDSTYDLGDSARRWKDLWLSGNTLHLGSQTIKSRTDGVYANDKKLAFADSSLDSAEVLNLLAKGEITNITFQADSDTAAFTWNTDEQTLNLTYGATGVALQLGQEEHAYAKATEAISNGDVVQFAGAQGNHLLIKKADASAITFEDHLVIGVATQDIANNEFGYVTTFGKVRDMDTSSSQKGIYCISTRLLLVH